MNDYPQCPVEAAFRDAAELTPAPQKDEDPFASEEYQKFVESMVPLCHCRSEQNRPCDGVLAGGLCDGIGTDGIFLERDEWREDDGDQ